MPGGGPSPRFGPSRLPTTRGVPRAPLRVVSQAASTGGVAPRSVRSPTRSSTAATTRSSSASAATRGTASGNSRLPTATSLTFSSSGTATVNTPRRIYTLVLPHRCRGEWYDITPDVGAFLNEQMRYPGFDAVRVRR